MHKTKTCSQVKCACNKTRVSRIPGLLEECRASPRQRGAPWHCAVTCWGVLAIWHTALHRQPTNASQTFRRESFRTATLGSQAKQAVQAHEPAVAAPEAARCSRHPGPRTPRTSSPQCGLRGLNCSAQHNPSSLMASSCNCAAAFWAL